jgi:hypothetical protein
MKGTNSAGELDHFYYSNNGYQKPQDYDHMWIPKLWSSSVNSEARTIVYALDVVLGGVYSAFRFQDVDFHVRCVRSR